MLREIDKNLWVSEQPFEYFGLEVGTRMTVIRLVSGELIVISPIRVDEITIRQINELGNVSAIAAPNCYHHLFISDFKSIYPDAEIWVAPGLEIKRPDLLANKILNSGQIGSNGEIDYLLFEGFQTFTLGGITTLNEIVFFHQESRTLILTDAAFHFDESFAWKTRFATRIIGGYRKLEPSLLEKLATRDKQKVRNSMQKILNWNFNRVIMAHGSIVEKNGKNLLKTGYKGF